MRIEKRHDEQVVRVGKRRVLAFGLRVVVGEHGLHAVEHADAAAKGDKSGVAVDKIWGFVGRAIGGGRFAAADELLAALGDLEVLRGHCLIRVGLNHSLVAVEDTGVVQVEAPEQYAETPGKALVEEDVCFAFKFRPFAQKRHSPLLHLGIKQVCFEFAGLQSAHFKPNSLI